MKFKILHKDNARYEAIRATVAENDRSAEISGSTLAVEDLPAFLNGTPPDVVIIDDARPACLDAVAALNLRTPGIETLLISDDTTADFLISAMRAGVREVIPGTGHPEALKGALTRLLHKRSNQGSANGREGQVFAFLSCKGGSGATFLASNFAYVAASDFGKRVALIDLNLQFGDAAIFVSESNPPSNVAELSQQIHRLDATLLAASMLEAAPNLFVLAAPDDPAQSADVHPEHVEAIVRLARANYDFVVIDVPRSLDAVSLQALDIADIIFPVLQLTLPYVRDGKRLLSIFRSLAYKASKIRVLVNRYERGGELTPQDLEQAIGGKISYVIANSYAAAAASVNLGIPIAKYSRANPISKMLVEMCREFTQEEEEHPKPAGWLSRMFSRHATI